MKRRISSNEKIYLTGSRHFGDLVMHAVIIGEGKIALQDLQLAVDQASQRVPGSRLRRQGKEWIADGKPPKVTMLEDFPDISGDLSQVATQHKPFLLDEGRTVSVELSYRRGQTLLIFRALHAVMDGKGLQLWMKTIFALLRRESPSHLQSMLTEDEVLKSVKKYRPNETLLPGSTGPQITIENEKDAFQFAYARRSLRGTFPGIIARLSIGVDKVLASNLDDRSLMMVPVDIRDEMPEAERDSTANLSIPLFLPVDKSSQWSTLSQALLDMPGRKDFLAKGRWDWLYTNIPSASFAQIFRYHWLSSLRRGRYMVSSVISHTGRQDLELWSTGDFHANEILFLPCVMPIAPLGIVISETETRTELVLTCPHALNRDALQLLDRILEAAELNAFVDQNKVGEDSAKLYQRPKKVEYQDRDLGPQQLIERRVQSSSQATALIYQEQTLSYEELNSRANRLARTLRAKGLRKGDFVGVGLERSFELFVAILAIIKAGGVYVPLDPSLPQSRLQFMIADSQAKWVLGMEKFRHLFGESEGFLAIDRMNDLSSDSSNLDLEIHPEDLCYMIYTSGSTGMPKGALNTHRGIVNHFLWMTSEWKLFPSDTTLQKTPISFDASLLEIFLPLLVGAKVCIAEPDRHKDAAYLLNLMDRYAVTFLSIVPSIFQYFLEEVDNQANSPLRLVLFGGEEFTRKLFDRFKQRFPNAVAVNLYGPAEAAIDTVAFDTRNGFEGRTVPIGRTVTNTEAYIVDEQMNLVEAGELGELLLTGPQIGLGYWNQKQLTETKYIKNPFDKTSPYLVYRTGDLVRYNSRDQMEFVGRMDHQVKIRGVRIELGEIEAQIEALAPVKKAVVVAKEIRQEKALIAYWTGEGELDFRQLLKVSLPDYMIPAVFHKLDQLPLNANGKVDRLALPEVTLASSAEDAFQAEEVWQEKLLEIWSKALKQPIAKHTHFFEAGGNSLSAITLIVRTNAAYQCQLHPQDLLEYPRFEAFMNHLRKLRAPTN